MVIAPTISVSHIASSLYVQSSGGDPGDWQLQAEGSGAESESNQPTD